MLTGVPRRAGPVDLHDSALTSPRESAPKGSSGRAALTDVALLAVVSPQQFHQLLRGETDLAENRSQRALRDLFCGPAR